VPAASQPTRTLLALGTGTLAFSLAQTMIVPALPQLQRDLHVSPADVTWLLTAFLLTSSVATPLLGRLGDMHGKERWLLICLALFGLGSVITALGTSLGVMVLGRAVQGAGGAIFPLSMGIVRDEFPPERVAVSIGTISATFGIGAGTGLVVAGLIVDHADVAWIFWLSVIVTALSALATWRWVPESPIRVSARIDWLGGLLLSLALGALLLAVSEGNVWGWGSAGVLGLLAGSAGLAALWTAWELRVVDPLVDLRLMCARPVWSTNLAGLMVGFSIFGGFILVPQLVEAVPAAGYGFAASATAAGLFLLPSSALMLVGGPFSGRLGTRFGSRLPLALGSLAAAAGYLLLALAHDARIEIYLASALLGLGLGLALAAMAHLIVEAVPVDMTGVASGINAIMRSIGGSIGAQLAAALVSASYVLDGRFPAEAGFTRAFAMSAAGALVAAVATLAIPGPARMRAHLARATS
jgi:EmrB/QacA subfamily drug resistance transporter